MAFSSNLFLFAFLPAVLAIYFAVPARHRNLVLLIVGLAFYSFDSGLNAWLLAFSIAFNHLIARTLGSMAGRKRQVLFVFAVVVNLAFLLHYKYTAFLLSALAPLVAFVHIQIGEPPAIALPIGISFFTFQALSYIADVYERRIVPAQRLVDFGAYHALFPQLIAGPIVRFIEIEKSIYHRVNSIDQIASGVFQFCLGLGKKLIIADTMASVVDPIFALPASELSIAVAWLGVACYTLQIYFDFSGYSDMAIGLGQILGFEFPENFHQPYRSRSVTEFWRRWHMTLSRWFRDYLYIPLGGNRRGSLRTYANLIVVFFLCGLWHGAGWTFVLWGLYHGALLVAERLYRHRFGDLPSGVFSWLLTLVLVMIGWVLFRSADLAQAGQFFAALGGFATPQAVYYPLPYFLTFHTTVFLAVGVAFALIPFETFSLRMSGGAGAQWLRAAASLGIFLYSILLLAANSFNPFIYFRF